MAATVPPQAAEIIAIGTELLLGEGVNTNTQFLAQELADLGIPHYFQTVVGEHPQRIHQALAWACQRANLLIFTGGLGPTPDNVTTAAIASFFQTPLANRPDMHADLERPVAHPVPVSTQAALLPVGAEILANETGNTPGMIWQPRSGLTILTFPEGPSETQHMWRTVAVPFLEGQGWGQMRRYRRVLRFWGVSASQLAAQVEHLCALEPTVTIATHRGETQLQIAVRAPAAAEAQALIAPIETQIRAIAGPTCFGSDQDTLASVVGQLLRECNHTLAVAESCTGGGLGHRITETPGCSAYFMGGVTAYDNAIKTQHLGVNPQDLVDFGAVSAAVAEQMAAGIRQFLGTDWGLSITGIAGPGGGTPTKPVGLICIGVAGPQGTWSTSHRLGEERDRTWVRHLSVSHALDQLRRQLLNATQTPSS